MKAVWTIATAVITCVLALAANIDRATAIGAAGTSKSTSCDSAEYRQFDFFVGDWDAYDFGVPDSVIARNIVTQMLGGCAIREVYSQRDGMKGESFSTFDAGRHVWHQSWVTNHGTVLLLDGRLKDGRMVLTATEHDRKGDSSLLRGTWIPQRGSVRETAKRSKDGGATWEPVFDIVFRPHRGRKST